MSETPETFIEKHMRSIKSRFDPTLCGCWKCVADRGEMRVHMILCPDCGCKRCPKASDHALACTGSNEPGQPGSVYTRSPHTDPQERT